MASTTKGSRTAEEADRHTEVHIDRVTITVVCPDKPVFMTLRRAADEFGLSPSYFRKLIREGSLPSYKGEGNGPRPRQDRRTDRVHGAAPRCDSAGLTV